MYAHVYPVSRNVLKASYWLPICWSGSEYVKNVKNCISKLLFSYVKSTMFLS